MQISTQEKKSCESFVKRKMKAIKEIKSGKRKKRFKKKLKRKHKKLNSKMLKKSEKPNSTLPDIQGYKEYNLERDVKCWSDDSRNKNFDPPCGVRKIFFK